MKSVSCGLSTLRIIASTPPTENMPTSSIGIDEIKRQNKWEICDLLIGYKNCISKKIKLAGVIGKKKDMSIRLRISRVLQIILSTY